MTLYIVNSIITVYRIVGENKCRTLLKCFRLRPNECNKSD